MSGGHLVHRRTRYNPGFLYQQNTMRDALVAGLTLNIFNKHSDRMKMANLAQIVNVLQSVILTEGDQMIKTPTYHVFDLYKYHQDSTLVESHIETDMIGTEQWPVPNLTESVSVDAKGAMHITVTNLSAEQCYVVDTEILDHPVGQIEGQILCNEMHAMNTFEEPDAVRIKAFHAFNPTESGLCFTIPACSVVHLAIG